jgi:hypothetical protein
VNARKAAVGVRLRIDLHRNARCLQLSRHLGEIAHAKVQHPLFGRVAEVCGLLRERCKRRRAGFLLPCLVAGFRGEHGDAEVILVPLRELLRLLRAEKEAADAEDPLHRERSVARRRHLLRERAAWEDRCACGCGKNAEHVASICLHHALLSTMAVMPARSP